MNEFLVYVERIVRPIQAIDERKDRMREELLAHLVARFEEQCKTLADESLARKEAIASMGDPAQLRSELQAAISRGHRAKARFERLFNWHAPEPAWKYTLRVGLFTGSSILLLLPLMVLPVAWQGNVSVLAVLRLLAPLAALVGLNTFALGYFYFQMRDALLGAFGTRRSWARAACYVVASSLVVEASSLFYLWSVTGEIGSDPALFAGRSLICLVLPVVGVLVAWRRGPQEIRHAMWECLEIGG